MKGDSAMKKKLFLFLLCGLLSGGVAADEPTFLYHCGFDSPGDLAPWSQAAGWEFAPGSGRNGTGAALLHRDAYTGPNVKMPIDNLKHGVLYRFTVWVRAEGLDAQGKNLNYGAFCVEYEKDGRWLSGNYPQVSSKSPEWKQYSLDFSLKSGADRANLVLYLRKGFKGKIFFDDLTLTEAGDPRAAILVTAPSQLTFSGSSGTLKISGTASGQERLTLSLQIIQAGHSRNMNAQETAPGRFTAELNGLSPGRLLLKMRLSNSSGTQTIAAAEQTMFVRPKIQRGIHFDDTNRMIMNGIPFMPVGIFGGFQTQEDLKRVRDAGFNTILQYDCFNMKFGGNGKNAMDTLRKALDSIDAAGLKLIFSLKDQYPGKQNLRSNMDEAGTPDEVTALAVRSLRGHPALLAWYLSDEDSRAELPRLIRMRERISELDPVHPTLTLTFRPDDLPVYGRSGDVLAIDDYPIRLPKHNSITSLMKLAELAELGGQPVWLVPQVFNWGIYKAKNADDFRKNFVFPSEAEMRAMVLTGIIHGARGFLFYSYMDVIGRLRKFAPEAEKEQWETIVRLVKFLKELEPFIMSKHGIEHLTVEQSGRGLVKASVLTADNGQRALVVIASDENAAGTVRLPPDWNGEKSFRFSPGKIDAVILNEKNNRK